MTEGTGKYSHKLDKHVVYAPEDTMYEIQEYGIDIKVGHIYLMGEAAPTYGADVNDIEEPGVDYVMANKFIKNLNVLMRKQGLDRIFIHMKTCGGDWNEGMAIYDIIKACPLEVVILNYTHARSMSSLIFQAADKRVMMPHSYFMLHEGEGVLSGTEKQIRSAYQFQRRTLDKQMVDVYVNAMSEKGKMAGKSKAEIRTWIKKQMNDKEELYLTAEEAVEYGLADEVFGSDGTYDWDKLVTVP